MAVIDVHTHMLTEEYLGFLAEHGGPKYELKLTKAGQNSIYMQDAPFMTLKPEMWNYDVRIRDMDAAGIDLAIVSLTCPNAFFGDESISVRTARMVNDSMNEQQCARPDRIAWFASIPWQHADAAVAELERATGAGAIGVMVVASIDGARLTDSAFDPVWQAIDDRGLPVLVHPTAPPGMLDMDLDEFGLVPPVGFMIDTTLAVSRMILSGFFDRFPNLKIIASHGGATLPYLAGRLDRTIRHFKIFPVQLELGSIFTGGQLLGLLDLNLGTDLGFLNALYTVSAFFHDAAHSDGDVGVFLERRQPSHTYWLVILFLQSH